jgi:hypothetical protein
VPEDDFLKIFSGRKGSEAREVGGRKEAAVDAEVDVPVFGEGL